MLTPEVPTPGLHPEATYLTPQNWGMAVSSRDIPGFSNWFKEAQFQVLAWGAACPIPGKVWADYQSMGREALDWLMNRYETTNAITQHVIWATAAARNPNLYKQLTTSFLRQPDELVGAFEAKYVPSTHKKYVSPMSSLPGYAGARDLILALGTDQVETILQSPEKMQIVNQAVDQAKTPAELLAYLALAAFRAGANPGTILEHSFETDKVGEEGYVKAFREQLEVFAGIAPELIRAWTIMELLASPQTGRSEKYFQRTRKYDPSDPNKSLTAYLGSPQRLEAVSLIEN